jgi:predicted DNA binding protein
MREAVLAVGDAELSQLGLDDLVSICREAGLRDFEELECQGAGAIVQVALDRQIDEDRLDDLPAVDWWEPVRAADHFRYVISFTAPDLDEGIAEYADEMVGTCDPELAERGATVSFVGPQDAIRGTVREYEAAGASPALEKLGAYEGRKKPLDALTDRQREVIRRAFELGHYEVPREVSTEDVAEELDVDSSTVAEHLQRAERNLLAGLLSGQQ